MLPALSASPRSGVLTGWGNAWLAGLVGLDDVITQVHRALGGAPAPHTLGDEPLVLGLGALRAAGAERLRLVLPIPGDAAGLPGPPEVNRDAITAGEAVIVVGPVPPLALVPGVVVHGPAVEGRLESVHWRVLSAARTPPPGAGLRAAEHELSDAIRTTTAALVHLDIASARPEVMALLRDRGEPEPGPGLGPGHPPGAHALLARAERLSALLDLAARDDGAAVTAVEIARRTAALRGLSAAVRHAYEAAYDAFDPSYATVRPPR
ncbi:hypothetical protein [Frankia sp. AgB32]|uniref:hypothetical protein n=1 Tax=Frankia sp. AgB32 TaxID=631119 RepID=UPI00200C450D|nr:hypothetical protein [Frankia sp. AgB32]MCK9894847.1 hypothetical protein [Frankia sp. AgB32]